MWKLENEEKSWLLSNDNKRITLYAICYNTFRQILER